MSRFATILREHGYRNAGDNLLGFIIDMEHFLEDSDLFISVDVRETKLEDCMLIATCELKPDVQLANAKEEIQKIWEQALRYRHFAEVSLEDLPNGFGLSFVTTAPRLGVAGRIECFKTDAEPDAAPNGGAATPSGNSGAAEKPPSVS